MKKDTADTSFIEEDPKSQGSTKTAAAQFNSGQAIAHYRIICKIGSGGMGEVYLAEDVRLGRRVALKILAEEFVRDNYRLHRFRQEARAASALNHPNIITIHDIGDADGVSFITTEFIEGETLREKLVKEKMSIPEVLNIALQVASALASAHQAGIIHRDLKPENVMLRTDGYVKLLDFGLAKLSEKTRQNNDDSIAEFTETRPGIVIGTGGYMSPEQARGQDVDAASDVFSFGVMLYEMVTRKKAFRGPTISDVIVEILTKEPKPLDKYTDVPVELKRIITKCMQKDRQLRYHSARELQSDLQGLKQQIDSGSTVAVGNKEQSHGRYRNFVLGFSILAIALAIGFIIYSRTGSHRSTTKIKSVAVLPLKSLDKSTNSDSTGLKLADALIQRLGRLHQIVVRPTRAIEKYQGDALNPISAGQEQNVDAILDASYQREGERLRVTARLLRVSDGRQLWEGTFEESGNDPFALQDMLAEQAAQAILPELSGAQRKLITKHDTENAEANRYYAEGRYHWNKRNYEGMRKSIQLFEQAIKLDPNYARAYSGLSDSYITLADYGDLPAKEAYPKAKEAAQKALSLDNTSFEAYTSLAMVKSNYEWDWAGADQAFRRAIQMNANYATAHQWYAEFLAGMNRKNEALDHIHQAEELDPLSLIIQAIEASIYNYGREYDRTIDQAKRVIQRDPNFAEVYAYLGLAFQLKGMYRESMDAYEKYSTLMGRNTPEASAIRTAPVSGEKDFWMKMIELAKPPTGSDFDYAVAFSRLGEKSKAIDMLEKACEKRSNSILYFKVDPNLDPLRSEPRFQALLKRVNLTP